MHLCINELSFHAKSKSKKAADQLMNNLYLVILALKKIKKSDPICTTQTLWKKKIYKNYNINNWLNDIDNKDKKRLFMIVASKGPYTETLLDDKYSGFYECRLKNNNQDVTASSIAAAALLKGILISMADSGEYILPEIELKYCFDEKPFIETKILNFIEPIAAENYVKSYLLNKTSSWKDLWKEKEELFSNIFFCEAVYAQLKKLDFSYADIVKIHLSKINNYLASLPKGQIPDYKNMGIDASTESETTLKQFGKERKFKCPDGKIRLFSWHTKQQGENIRIHFYPPDIKNKKLIIGYIGLHLKTVKYR
jgi:hypothetical protein